VAVSNAGDEFLIPGTDGFPIHALHTGIVKQISLDAPGVSEDLLPLRSRVGFHFQGKVQFARSRGLARRDINNAVARGAGIVGLGIRRLCIGGFRIRWLRLFLGLLLVALRAEWRGSICLKEEGVNAFRILEINTQLGPDNGRREESVRAEEDELAAEVENGVL